MAEVATLQIKVDSTDARKATTDLDKLGSSAGLLEGMIAKLAAAAAALGLAKMVQESVLLAARYETLGVAMRQVGANAGYTTDQMNVFAQGLMDQGISMVEARSNLTKMATAHMDLAQAQKLARAAQDFAVIGNLNSSETFQRMIHGLQSGQTEVLRTIGINIQFEQGYKKLGLELGKAAKDLSEREKAQSRMNQLLEFAVSAEGTYEAAMGTAGKQLHSMARLAEDAQLKLGEVFQPALSVGVTFLSTALKDLQDWLDKNTNKTRALGVTLADAETQMIGFGKALGGIANKGTEGIEWMDLVRSMIGGVAGAFAVAGDVVKGVAIIFSHSFSTLRAQFADVSDMMARFSDLTPGGKGTADKFRGFSAWLDKSNERAESFRNELALGATGLERWASSAMKADAIAKGLIPEVKKQGPAAAIMGDLTDTNESKGAKQNAEAVWNLMVKLEDEVALFGKSKAEIELYNAAKLDLTETEAKYILAKVQEKELLQSEDDLLQMRTQDTIKAENDLTDALNRQAAARLDAHWKKYEALKNDGARLTEEMQSPEEKQIADLTKLEAMLKGGVIGQETYQRKLLQLRTTGVGTFSAMADSINSMTRGLEDAFVRFATTGKFSFKDMANSIIADLIRIESQKAFSTLASWMIKAGVAYFSGAGDTSATNVPGEGLNTGMAAPGGGLESFASPVAGGVSSSVTVNITDGKAASDSKGDGANGAAIGRSLEAAMNAWAVKNMRPGGVLNPVGA